MRYFKIHIFYMITGLEVPLEKYFQRSRKQFCWVFIHKIEPGKKRTRISESERQKRENSDYEAWKREMLNER